MPASSVMAKNGPRMIEDVWTAFGDFYNARLQNLAGPWDRSYGWDMNKYVAIMSLYIWSIAGREHVFSSSEKPWLLTHADDGEFVPIVSILSSFHNTMVPANVVARLKSFGCNERIVQRHAYSPPFDLQVRNITTWLSEKITIGGDSYNQTVVGGFSKDSNSFSPAIAHWYRSATKLQNSSVGYFSLHPSEKSLKASVGAHWLNLTYPAGNASSVFTFAVSSNPLGGTRDVNGLDSIDGVSISIGEGSNIDPTPKVSFCGLMGGDCDPIQYVYTLYNTYLDGIKLTSIATLSSGTSLSPCLRRSLHCRS